MADLSPEFEAWVEQARQVDILDAATARGCTLKRQGSEWAGPCPACGGTDKFSISPSKRVFNCSHVGGPGGDVIAMVQHIAALDFVQAVESLTGEPPPRGQARERDPEAERERREERRENDRSREEQEREARERKASAAERFWDSCRPIEGTHADAYLRRRRIFLRGEQGVDLRFCSAVEFRGYASSDREATEDVLGTFPIMAAAIRDVDGRLIGVHRTYLDATEPKKLVPPGDRRRNKAKKVLGSAKGGAIWFGRPGPAVAIGEGIETVLSWFALGRGPEEAIPVSGVSLGNMAGGATGTWPHPGRSSRVIPNCEPDPERPGIRLPSCVREVILLGDSDSDPAWTTAMLMTAGRRFVADGLGVSADLAPAGKDWNDVHVGQAVP